QEAGHLVITGADAAQQALDATGGVPDPEHLLDPEADLIGVAEAAGADLLLEALHLSGGEGARVAPVVGGAEGVEALAAVEAEPLGDLADAATQQGGDLEAILAVGDPEDGRKPLRDALVVGFMAAALHRLALRRVKVNQPHRTPSRASPGPAGAGNHGQ